MEKYCEYCGMQAAIDVAVCPICGTAFPPTKPMPITPPPAKRKRGLKQWILIGGAIVNALALILGLTIGLVSQPADVSYTKSTQAALRIVASDYSAVLSGDNRFMPTMAPPQFWDYMAKASGLHRQALYEQAEARLWDHTLEMLNRDSCDKIHVSLADYKDVSQDNLERIATGLAKYGIRNDQIQDAKILTLSAKGYANGARFQDQTLTVTAVQINGEWYLLLTQQVGQTLHIQWLVE